MSKKATELESRYNAKISFDKSFEKIYFSNGFSHPYWGIITCDNTKEISLYYWGLIPFWVKTPEEADKIKKLTLNAKAETIYEKPSFNKLIKRKRCLVPSTGFFEWRHEKGEKIPYFIKTKNEIFSMAGIFDNWVNKSTGEIVNTFSIITTKANSMMSFIHNTKKRMPVILKPENENLWLDISISDKDIVEIMNDNKVKDMVSYRLYPDFKKYNYDDPELIKEFII